MFNIDNLKLENSILTNNVVTLKFGIKGNLMVNSDVESHEYLIAMKLNAIFLK